MAEQDPNRRIETPSVDVPPLPPRQGRRWGRWLLIGGIGCLGLLVLLLIGFAGCAALLSSGDGGGEAPKDTYASKKEQAVPLGETVEVGNVAWTINNVQQSTELKALGQRKRGNFVTIELTFINNGDEAVTLDSESLAIIDDQNRTHGTDTDASLYVPTDRDLFLNQVNPGVTFQGTAIFNIAPDAKGLLLEAGDTEMFTDENAYVDLGI